MIVVTPRRRPQATIFHEDEIAGLNTLVVGDAIAVTGSLDVHAAEDRLGRKRIAFCIIAKQLLTLRGRSTVKAAATRFLDEPPQSGGFVRPRIG
jgi:hypothetical protein